MAADSGETAAAGETTGETGAIGEAAGAEAAAAVPCRVAAPRRSPPWTTVRPLPPPCPPAWPPAGAPWWTTAGTTTVSGPPAAGAPHLLPLRVAHRRLRRPGVLEVPRAVSMRL